MARYPGLSPEKQESLRRYVEEDRATPKELAVIFGVTPATIYNYLQRLNLPICKPGDYRKFYDPGWELPHASCPRDMPLSTWGPWVSLLKVPPSERHPSITKTNTLPLSAMILAQYHFKKMPNLLYPCVKFKDGNYMNVTLENMEIDVVAHPGLSDMLRSEHIRSLAAKEQEHAS